MTELSVEEKRKYLELYALQQAKIDRYSALTVRNSDKKRKYRLELAQARAVRDIIEEDIEKIEDKKECEVLAQKYLCGKSFGETAELLNYSRRQIERIHLSGLEHLRPRIEKVDEIGGNIKNGKNCTSLRPQ